MKTKHITSTFLGLSLFLLTNTTLNGYCICPGYLAIIGPSPIQYSSLTEPFDRHNLFIIADLEEELFQKAEENDAVQNELLNEIHERNLEIVEEGVEDLVVESPLPEPVFVEPIPAPINIESSGFNPEDLLYIENEGIGDAGADAIGLPFQMPFSTGSNNFPPIPSKAVFEQK